MTAGGPATNDGAALASSVQGVMRATVPLLATIGIEVVEAEPGRVRTRLPFRRENCNHIGTVYAGVLFSFLESSGGALVVVAFDVTRFIPVIVEGTIRYLRPVTGAVEAEMSVTDTERDEVHRALEADPKYSWTLNARAVGEDGRDACEADFVYRFKAIG